MFKWIKSLFKKKRKFTQEHRVKISQGLRLYHLKKKEGVYGEAALHQAD